MLPASDDVCWICHGGDGLVRNPADCSCVSGGWTHRACLATYAAAAGTRLSFRLDGAQVHVAVDHAPCGHRMQLGARPMPSMRRFWYDTINMGLRLGMRAGTDDLPWHGVVHVALTTTTVLAAALPSLRLTLPVAAAVVLVPPHPCEILVMRYTLGVLLALWLLPGVPMSVCALFMATLSVRRCLFVQYHVWLQASLRDLLAAEAK